MDEKLIKIAGPAIHLNLSIDLSHIDSQPPSLTLTTHSPTPFTIALSPSLIHSLLTLLTYLTSQLQAHKQEIKYLEGTYLRHHPLVLFPSTPYDSENKREIERETYIENEWSQFQNQKASHLHFVCFCPLTSAIASDYLCQFDLRSESEL
jgi:hypothetical protein